MKRRLLRVSSALAAVAVLGAALLLSGLVSVSALQGHFTVTEAVLQFAKRRSVATHALGVEDPPDLEDPVLVMRGAGHYESGCLFCHGAPGVPASRVASAMLPPPPDLRRHDLSPAELFWSIRHGYKMTGMPAWPAEERSDEVWALVAFVEALPAMDAPRYAWLARGAVAEPGAESDAPAIVRTECARCHGLEGEGREGSYPRIGGQQQQYLRASLDAYRAGRRPSGIMETVTTGLQEADLEAAVQWYAGRESGGPGGTGPERGSDIAHRGIPARGIPACVGCHGPTDHPHHPAYPLLAGQNARYHREQLALFGRGVRGGSRFAELMDPVARHDLEADERHAVAAYYAALEPMAASE